VLLLFFVAVAFLVRSMTKHLKRVPESFDTEPADGTADEKAGDRDDESPAEASAPADAPVEAAAEDKKS
jgi:hypothetical protein